MNTSKHKPTDADMFRLWSKVIPDGDCWRWSGPPDKNGYFRTKFQGKKIHAHRLFFELAHGAVPEGRQCCHTCRTKGCVNPHHIYAGTASDNARDAIKDGTAWCLRFVPPAKIGEAHPEAKLTNAMAAEIREARQGGMYLRDVAKKFGVSVSTVHRVATGQTWVGEGETRKGPRKRRGPRGPSKAGRDLVSAAGATRTTTAAGP